MGKLVGDDRALASVIGDNPAAGGVSLPLGETDGGTGQTTYVQGDILYASAADTLSRLAKGSIGDILTQGATVPSWAPPSGGGVSPWTASFGSGGDYSTAALAIAAGNSVLCQVGAATETGDIAVPTGGLSVYKPLGSGKWSTKRFTFSGDDVLWIEGEGEETELEASPAASSIFGNSVGNGRVVLKDILLDHDGTSYINFGPISVYGCKIEFPNISNSGFYTYTGDEIVNTEFVGGGTTCASCIITQTGVSVVNLLLTGTFDPTPAANTALLFKSADYNTVDGLTVALSSGGVSIGWFSRGHIRGVNVESGNLDVDVVITAEGCSFSDWQCGLGTTAIDMGGVKYLLMSRIYNLDTLTSNSTTEHCDMSMIHVNNAVSIDGEHITMDQCKFRGGLTYLANSNDNTISDSSVGADNGGGGNTITYNASSTNNHADNCRTDVAIVDNGTGNVQTACWVY
jgi:hypothetical protein